MRACWLKWVGRDWSISADYIWLNYSGANITDDMKNVMNELVNCDTAEKANSYKPKKRIETGEMF